MAKPIINTRVGHSQLTWQQLDDNFTNLQNATIGIQANDKSYSIDLNSGLRFSEGSNIVLSLNESTGVLTINASAAPYTLPTATTTVLGGVKPDGTTITVTQDGTISASAATYTTVLKQLVKNTTGSTLLKGQPVYINGSNGQNVTVALASASSEATSSKTIGLLDSDIADGSTGYVITNGLITGVNTQAANAGDAVWLSPTAGQIVFGLANKPSAPNHLVYLGVVEYVGNNTGRINISVQNGFEINELHNVTISSVANNDLLTYNSTTSLWENKQLTSSLVTGALGFTPYHTGSDLGTPSAGDLSNCTFPVASTTVSGTVKVDGTTVTITNGVISAAGGSSYTLPTASNTVLGGVKVDDNTVKIDGSGIITSGELVRIRVYNNTGSTIAKGKVVMTDESTNGSGIRETSDHAAYIKLSNTIGSSLASNIIGVVDADITTGTYGYCVSKGIITGINTSNVTMTYATQDLYNALDGGFSASKTSGMGYYIGKCLRSHATLGTILVDIKKNPSISELSYVSATAPQDGQVLRYSSSNSQWEPYTLSSTYILPTASSTVLGGVKIGTGLSIDGSGSLSASQYSLPTASDTVLGGVKVDAKSITISNGVIKTSTRIGVFNNTGSTISKGMPVEMYTPYTTDGVTGFPYVVIGSLYNSGGSGSSIIGLAEADITTGYSGYVITQGVISGIDTSYLSPAGRVYLGNLPNRLNLTSSASTSTGVPAVLGTCLSSNVSGSILVNINHTPVLKDVGGVIISNVQTNDVLTYDSTGSWKNKPISIPTASDTVLGLVKVDGTTITITNGVISSTGGGGSYTLPTASTTTLGGVKIDGTTITITNGVISASGGSGSYTLPTASSTVLGGIKIGSGLSIDANGVVTASGGSGGSVASGFEQTFLLMGA